MFYKKASFFLERQRIIYFALVKFQQQWDYFVTFYNRYLGIISSIVPLRIHYTLVKLRVFNVQLSQSEK